MCIITSNVPRLYWQMLRFDIVTRFGSCWLIRQYKYLLMSIKIYLNYLEWMNKKNRLFWGVGEFKVNCLMVWMTFFVDSTAHRLAALFGWWYTALLLLEHSDQSGDVGDAIGLLTVLAKTERIWRAVSALWGCY